MWIYRTSKLKYKLYIWEVISFIKPASVVIKKKTLVLDKFFRASKPGWKVQSWIQVENNSSEFISQSYSVWPHEKKSCWYLQSKTREAGHLLPAEHWRTSSRGIIMVQEKSISPVSMTLVLERIRNYSSLPHVIFSCSGMIRTGKSKLP